MSIVTLNDRAVRSVSTFGSLSGGSMVFIKKLTASSSGDLSFVNGASSVVLDSTYKEYLFTFKDIHPSDDTVRFQFNMSADGGSNYNVTKTTTAFNAYHYESDSGTNLGYDDDGNTDLAQGTGFQNLTNFSSGADNDQSLGGYLQLFNPSSTTFVKHFISRINNAISDNRPGDNYIAGYGNTTSAVNAIQFKFASGNIDAGDICLYGIL
jgi:hypothetical protein|tara:strand:- start:30 stop:656 length:627 start_codon:yes stop_codon:yes gene_type:complete